MPDPIAVVRMADGDSDAWHSGLSDAGARCCAPQVEN